MYQKTTHKRTGVYYVAKVQRRKSPGIIRAFIPNPYEVLALAAILALIKFLG